MKVSSKSLQVTLQILCVGALGLTSMPVASSAASVAGATAQAAKTVAQQNMCTRISNFGQTALTNIANRVAKVTSDRAADDAKLSQEEATFDATVAADRTKADQARAADLTKLEAAATTTTQKAAVQTFEQSVTTTVATRRTTIDAARNTFRTSLTQAITTRRSEQDQAFDAFRASVNTAISQAQATCSGSNPTGAGTTFVAALKSARTTFQSAIAAVPKLAPAEQQLAQARTQAVQEAITTFKTVINQAAQTLQTALKS